MSKSAPAIPADKMDLYEKLVATQPSVERKGATMPYTSVNGHMFSFLTKSGTMALRLPPEERASFLRTYSTRRCEQHGTVLEEYVEVPAALLRKTQALKGFFELSFRYVSALAPKATKTAKPIKDANPTKNPTKNAKKNAKTG